MEGVKGEGGTEEEKVKEKREDREKERGSNTLTYHDIQCVHCSPLSVKAGDIHKDHTRC